MTSDTVRLTRRPVMARRTLIGGAMSLATLSGLAACAPADSGSTPSTTPPAGADVKESPMLTKLVEAGELPPLEERLPTNPVVVDLVEGPGQYGGTLRYASTSDGITPITILSPSGYLEWDLPGLRQLPSVAESFEPNETSDVWTITIRDGLKWSDGEPFTSDDVDFAFADYLGNDTIFPAAPYFWSDANQNKPTVDWVDDRTFTVTFGTSNPLFPQYMAHVVNGWQLFKPMHYLKQFHPDHVGDEEATKVAKAAGFDTWDKYFVDRSNAWVNPDLPVLGAYRVVSPSGGSGTATLERNPYYFKTDPDGRQLPYIDRISVQILNQEALDLRAANGELDLQGTGLAFSGAQVLLENADDRGYRVARWVNSGGTAAVIPNLSHKDPELRELFTDVRFRQALSHAINRDDVNEALLSGIGVIRQPIASEGTDYWVEGAGETFLEYDPAKSEALLDELGMTKTGQWRTRPDGKPFEPVMMFVESSNQVPLASCFQMVINDFAKVGLKVVLKPVDGTLYTQLRVSNDFDLDGTSAPSDHMDLEDVWWIPTSASNHFGAGFGQYYQTKGESGEKPTPEMQQLMDNWDALKTANNDEERIAAGQAIIQQHKEKVYMIGVVRPPFQPVVVTEQTKNVLPDEAPFSYATGREGLTHVEQVWLNQE